MQAVETTKATTEDVANLAKWFIDKVNSGDNLSVDDEAWSAARILLRYSLRRWKSVDPAMSAIAYWFYARELTPDELHDQIVDGGWSAYSVGGSILSSIACAYREFTPTPAAP